MEKIVYLKNSWYVAAEAGEIGRSLLGRWICDEPLVIYRKVDGRIVILEDRCPHRKFALSKGELIGDEVQCGYHGMCFDGAGKCTAIPGQKNIPPRLKARSFPVEERHSWIWVWMGDPEKADTQLIPDYHWNQSDGWAPVNGYMKFDAEYILLVDNLLDLTHETYVHQRTIGNQAVAHTPMETRTEGDTVYVDRIMKDCPPPPLFKKAKGFKENIDRWQHIWFEPPANIWIDAGGVPTGETDRSNALNWMVLNSITPERQGSCHYFWGISRCFSQDDKEIDELIRNQITATFEEDRDIIETQQRYIDTDKSQEPLRAANCDAGNVFARRIIDRLMVAEQDGAQNAS